MTTTFLDRWRLPLAVRSDELEIIDGDELDPHDLAVNLRELAMLNRLPGGIGASLAAINRLASGRRDLEVLDAGTGGGDMALAMARHGRSGAGEGRWRVIAADRSEAVLAQAAGRMADDPHVSLLRADALALPLDDGAVDVAHASLLLHHLEPVQAGALLRELARVSRIGVVVNDLRRGPVSYLATALTVLALCRGRYTRRDGLASARRAYTLAELDELLAAAGLRVVERIGGQMPRVVTGAVPHA